MSIEKIGIICLCQIYANMLQPADVSMDLEVVAT